MNRIRIALLPVFLLGFAAGSSAQTVTTRLEGTVQDSTGAVVPGAAISARDVKTQVHNELTSDAQGHFTFPSLQPGVYTLTITATGFQKEIVSGLELNAAAIVNQIVRLQVGQASESVSISASEETVQTTDSQVGRSITLRDIDTLPQLGRTPLSLSTFVPGAQINPGDVSFTHINGQRQGSNNLTLDGIDANDSVAPRLGLSLTATNTDSIGEFRMVTDGGKAEYGRNAGGQVQLITRSGTNQVHGGVFEYLRNTDLNANDFFNNAQGTARPKFIQNIYGFSLGGPVVFPKIYNGHNKTFIFGNFQGRRTTQEVVRNRTVLTPDAKKGLFDYTLNGARQQYNIVANDPRHIGIDPAVAKVLALLPDPNNTDLGDGLETAGYRFNNPVPSIEDQFTIKGDHNINDNQHLFLRWSWQRNSAIDNLNNADAVYPGQAQGSQGGHRWGFSTGYDWNIDAATVNEFRAGHQSANVSFLRPARLQGPTLISNDYTDPILANFAQARNSPVNQFSDNITHVFRKHTVKGGMVLDLTDQFGTNDAGIYPNVTFTTGNGNAPPASVTPAGVTGTNLTNFQNLYNELLGRVNQVTGTFYSNLNSFQPAGSPRVRNFNIHDVGYYIQDDFRVNRRLTLNYGLRWDILGSPSESQGLQGTLVEASQVANGVPLESTTLTPAKHYYKTDYNNFAPRFGFAYDLMGDGRTAIRGNYGIFFDRTLGASVSSTDGNTPGFAQTVNVFPNANGTDFRVSDGLASILPTQPAAPVLTLPDTRSTSVILYNPNLRTGYVQQFGLNVQRQLFRNTVLEAGYVGSRGVKLFLNRDVNQQQVYGDFLNAFKEFQAYVPNGSPTGPVPSANNLLVKIFGTPAAALTAVGASNFTNGALSAAATAVDRNNFTKYAAAGIPDNFLRKYPQYNQVILGTNDGRNYYDSLQVSLRRSTGSLHMSANYTFSKSLDNISAEGNGYTAPIDSYNLGLNKAVSDFNHPHSFNASASYTLPIGRGKRFGGGMNRWADALIGGWDIGTLFIWQSGSPFSVSGQYATGPGTGLNSFALFSGSDRGLGGVSRQGNGVFYFSAADAAQFSVNRIPGYIGNAGRNSFIGPRFLNDDASLVKRFRITEHHAVTFRAEAYNLANNPTFGLPGTNLLTPASFGKISTTQGAQNTSSSGRVLQAALRYDF
jgi:hypothetical protein